MVSFAAPDPAHVVAQPVEEPVMRLRLVVDARGDLPQHGDAIPHVVDGGVVLALERLRVLFHLHLHRVGVAEEARAASAPGKTGWRWVRRTRQRGKGPELRGEKRAPQESRVAARGGDGVGESEGARIARGHTPGRVGIHASRSSRALPGRCECPPASTSARGNPRQQSAGWLRA